MILGIGTDLVEIKRITKFLEGAAGERFIERVLTPAERKAALERQGRLAEFVAGRFAAKEAIVKALGTGIGRVTGLQDLEILPHADGRPTARLSEQAMERLGYTAAKAVSLVIHISITHTTDLAAAYAVIEERT